MTYEELMNDENIKFVLFRPGLTNPEGVTIIKKAALNESHLVGYTYKGLYNSKSDIVEFAK